MTKGEKKYIGNALRWGLFALIVILLTAAVLIGRFAPDDKILRYSGGRFYVESVREKYFGFYMIPACIAAALIIASVLFEFFTKQHLADKIARAALTLLLGFIACAVFVFGGLYIVGLGDVNIPFGAEEYEAYGHTFVVCADPHGLHHSHPAIYDITDGEPVRLWEGGAEYMDSSISEGFHIEPGEDGWLVSCTVITDNGKTKEKRSFTIGKKEDTP